MAEPIWKDRFYTLRDTESVVYTVVNDATGVVIHRGKAVMNPATGQIDIPVNRIVAFYVNNDLKESFFTDKRYSNNIPSFSMYVDDTFVGRYEFTPDWSYDRNTPSSLVHPINGHYIAGSEIWYSN